MADSLSIEQAAEVVTRAASLFRGLAQLDEAARRVATVAKNLAAQEARLADLDAKKVEAERRVTQLLEEAAAEARRVLDAANVAARESVDRGKKLLADAKAQAARASDDAKLELESLRTATVQEAATLEALKVEVRDAAAERDALRAHVAALRDSVARL